MTRGGFLDPGTELGGYRIESVLGRGGMGVVYLATHIQLGRKVALKVLSPDLSDDEEFRSRFIRESQLAASLEHPNILPIYDAGEDDGEIYLAMRYVEGGDLRVQLKQLGRLPVDRTVTIVRQIALALDVAHTAGLVHRDVKPANILLGAEDHAYLSDFGLARRSSSASLTRTGMFLGSVDYCPPEQIDGKPLDGRADIYALGCVAFHCLTGQPPFVRESEVGVIKAHLFDPAPSLTSLRPDLPEELSTALASAMAKDPDERYARAADLAAALAESTAEHQIPSDDDTIGETHIAPTTREALELAENAPSPTAVPASPPPAPRRGLIGQKEPEDPPQTTTSYEGNQEHAAEGSHEIDEPAIETRRRELPIEADGSSTPPPAQEVEPSSPSENAQDGAARANERVDEVRTLWSQGYVEDAARLLGSERQRAAENNDATELAELDLLVASMRASLSEPLLTTFDALVHGYQPRLGAQPEKEPREAQISSPEPTARGGRGSIRARVLATSLGAVILLGGVAAALYLVLGRSAGGATIDVIGTVLSSDNRAPIVGARVIAGGLNTVTTRGGRFRINGISPGATWSVGGLCDFTPVSGRFGRKTPHKLDWKITLKPLPVAFRTVDALTRSDVAAFVTGPRLPRATATPYAGESELVGPCVGEVIHVTSDGYVAAKAYVPLDRHVSLRLIPLATVRDSFSGSDSRWLSTWNRHDGNKAYIAGGKYHIKVAGGYFDTGTSAFLPPGNTVAQSARIRVTATAVSGSSSRAVGVVCASDLDAENTYFLLVSANGTYGIDRLKGGHWTSLVAPWKYAAAIHRNGGTNTIEATCRHEKNNVVRLTLSVNGTLLTTVDDPHGFPLHYFGLGAEPASIGSAVRVASSFDGLLFRRLSP